MLAGCEPAQPAELEQVTERYLVPVVPQAPVQPPQLPVCHVPWATATQEPLTSHGLKQLFPSKSQYKSERILSLAKSWIAPMLPAFV